MIEEFLTLLVASLVVLGACIALVAAIGLLRLPDLFTRMHAVSKAGTAGSGLALVAVALQASDILTTVKCLVALLFLFLTAPISAHLLAKAELRSAGSRKDSNPETGA